MKTRVCLKYFANDCGYSHMDMDGFRLITTSSRLSLADCGWFRVVMVGLGWLQMFLGEWFWIVVDGFACLQMALGGFRWFPVICNSSSYSEIRCLKFKRSRQIWRVFAVPSNNDAKVPLKQMTKFLGNSTYKVLFKKTLGGWENFCLMKIDMCSFM